ncbi:MAG: YidC/Oxa1 family membrane protein insertase [Chloroflexia bacterium]
MSGGLFFLVAIPLWDQFVGLMKASLEFLAQTTGSPGLAIIIFTVFIKLVLTPLNIRTIKSQREMQNLQPKIKALQKKYKDDRQKLSAETMRLYQEHNINPMASCLPIVFQLPIFWGMYGSLRALSGTVGGPFQDPFLWLPSLGHPDPLHIMPFVAAFFQLIQTRMSMPTGKYKPTDPQQQMMTQLMQFLPITVIIFGWGFPSGLVLYWATQSVFGAVQQYFITGWGALREWLTFLPEVHRYTPPDPDLIDESALVAREGGSPALKKGFWGAVSRQIEKVEEQRAAQRGATEDDDDPVPSNGKSNGKSAVKSNGNGNGAVGRAKETRVTVRNSAKARPTRNGAASDGDSDSDEVDDVPEAKPAGPSPRVTVRKSAPEPNGRGER